MLNSHRTAKISPITGLALNEDVTEINYSRFKNLLKIFDLINVEERGIDRILPEERTDSTIVNTAMIWIGANTVLSSFAAGTLGPCVFKLNFYNSLLTIIFSNLLGLIPVAGISCFGPSSGLRTMVFCRYSWGYYGASIMSIFNVIAALCWASIISITSAQTLRVVSNDSLSISVGIILISIITMIVSFVGYKWIHIYERFLWIPVFIVG